MFTDDQRDSLAERFVLSFEKIASALEGVNETYRRHYTRQYPEPGPVRDAVVTRVPTEEDRIREAHGASTRPISEWLEELDGEERAEAEQDIGEREREWIERNKQQKRHAGATGNR